jgi:hypothetical protein
MLCGTLRGPCCGRKRMEKPSIEELNQNPTKYLDALVIVSGFLTNKGENYFKDLDIVLEDSLGNTISVLPWIPIEIPPARDPSLPRPVILRDYIDKTIKLKGYLRHNEASLPSKYKYYFEVKEAEILKD